MSDDKVKLAHEDEFDGIAEEDNPMPQWWLMTFYGTVIFAIIYWYIWHVKEDRTMFGLYEKEKAQIEEMQKNARGPEMGADVLAAAAQDPQRIEAGKLIYVTQCQVCHAAGGAGLIGPNLTDNYWKSGKGSLEDIKHVIEVGVPDKGMIAWANILKPDDIINVTAFVKSLQGTNPAGAKAPEGDLVE